MVSIEIQVPITDENIEDIIDMAGYGIAYWALEASAYADAAPEGTVSFFQEGDSGEVHYLSADDIREGFSLALNDERMKGSYVRQYLVDAVIGGNPTDGLDTGCIDADAGDVIFQYACFGELVYG